MMKRLINSFIIILVLVSCASAAKNESLLSPGIGMAWFWEQPEEFKDLILWIVGAICFTTGVTYIITSQATAQKGMLEKTGFSNPEKTANANRSQIAILATLIGMMLFLYLGLKLFGFF